MAMSPAKAQLLGLILELLFYGCYLVIWAECMNVLRKKHRAKIVNHYLAFTSVALFVCITTHMCTDVTRAVSAFTTSRTPEETERFYGSISDVGTLLKTSCYLTTTLISDAFIVYRCFIVWGRNYLVTALPFLLFLADVATGILATYTSSIQPVFASEDVYTKEMITRIPAFYSVTLCVNVISSGLIALRIYTIQKGVSEYAGTSDTRSSMVISMIIESCAIYSALLFVLIGTYAGSSPVMLVFLDCISPVIGIVFSSVIVRVGLGISHGDNKTSQQISTFQYRKTTQQQRSMTDSTHDYPLQVTLKQTVVTTDDNDLRYGSKGVFSNV